jgi:hypothetical protein
MRLWSCKADGKKTVEVEEELNFPISDYSDDEVTALQGCTQEVIIQKVRRTGQEERGANQSSGYTGVSLVKSTGRWKAQCQIGGKLTYMGSFGSEEEAARAWDRMRLWLCKAGGKKEEDEQLNFPLSDYSEDEVTALQGCTQEQMIQKLQRTAKQWRSECGANAVERPASPGPGATVGAKREAADVVPGVEAPPPAGQPPLKKIKVEEVETEEVIAAGGPTSAADDAGSDDEVEELTPEQGVKREQDDARELQLLNATCGKALWRQRPKPTPPGLSRDDPITPQQ